MAGAPGNCTSSKFEIFNISVHSVRGTTKDGKVSSFQCSGIRPCHDINITGEYLVLKSNGTKADLFLCSNFFNTRGFKCTGAAYEGGSATGECQIFCVAYQDVSVVLSKLRAPKINLCFRLSLRISMRHNISEAALQCHL